MSKTAYVRNDYHAVYFAHFAIKMSAQLVGVYYQ